MIIVILFVSHWYFSLFFQSFFNHRYAAHQMFTMSKTTEKVFYVLSWLSNGSSYLSPRIYAIMHRLHHAYGDTEKDPHSPKYSKNIFDMMWKTRTVYMDLFDPNKLPDKKYLKNLPDWEAFDKFADSRWTRLAFGALYLGIYVLLATAWWQFLLLPLTWIMGPLHGAVINWFAHKMGYTNFELDNTSKNFLPVDFLMWGESYHNNHHKRASDANFGYRWFEFDPMYPIIRFLDLIGVIKLKVKPRKQAAHDISFSRREIRKILQGMEDGSLVIDKNLDPEQKFKYLLENWEHFVKKDWKDDLHDYVQKINVRREIQVFLDHAGRKMRSQIQRMVEPIDHNFKQKMRPWDKALIAKQKFNLGQHYFWETQTIFQN